MKNGKTCQVNMVNEEKLMSVSSKMKSDKTMQLMAETFKALGDKTRCKILYALSCEELCVCDIARLLNVTKYAVSQQLRILRGLRLIKYRKEGKMVFYSLDDEHIVNLITEGFRHVEEEKKYE